MQIVCAYCKGSGLFRHERPPVTDATWAKFTGGKGICPLCKGKQYIERSLESSVIDTGLLFLNTLDRRILVACPDLHCHRWVDCTTFFTVKPRKAFHSKCPAGHEIVLEITP